VVKLSEVYRPTYDVCNRFMPPDDPLGRYGPSLDDLLRKERSLSEPHAPNCPYPKCTFGVKCRYYHPERATSYRRPTGEFCMCAIIIVITTSAEARGQRRLGFWISRFLLAGLLKNNKQILMTFCGGVGSKDSKAHGISDYILVATLILSRIPGFFYH